MDLGTKTYISYWKKYACGSYKLFGVGCVLNITRIYLEQPLIQYCIFHMLLSYYVLEEFA